MKAPTTEYVFSTPKAKYNSGYNDALNEMRWGGDRRFIEAGKPFCLPVHDKQYCNGYRQAFADRLTGKAA